MASASFFSLASPAQVNGWRIERGEFRDKGRKTESRAEAEVSSGKVGVVLGRRAARGVRALYITGLSEHPGFDDGREVSPTTLALNSDQLGLLLRGAGLQLGFLLAKDLDVGMVLGWRHFLFAFLAVEVSEGRISEGHGEDLGILLDVLDRNLVVVLGLVVVGLTGVLDLVLRQFQDLLALVSTRLERLWRKSRNARTLLLLQLFLLLHAVKLKTRHPLR